MRRPQSVDQRVARTERREPAEVAVGGEQFVNALADADRCDPGVVDQRAAHLPRLELAAQVGPVVVGLAEQDERR